MTAIKQLQSVIKAALLSCALLFSFSWLNVQRVSVNTTGPTIVHEETFKSQLPPVKIIQQKDISKITYIDQRAKKGLNHSSKIEFK